MTNPDELERLARAATPGPWEWMGSPHSLYLATTHSGRKYVMGFRRMGMQAAQPVFRVGERLVPASDLVMFEVGDGTARGFAEGEADPTVYRRDVSGVDAPDAAFIAAANPSTILALLSANREMREALEKSERRAARMEAALEENGNAQAWRDGFKACAEVVNSVRTHASWGPKATPDDGLKLATANIREAVENSVAAAILRATSQEQPNV